MTELEEVFETFKMNYGLEHCTVCMQPTFMKDAIGFPWCEEHAHHGKVLSWGRRHGYPELDVYPYKIGPSEHCWWIAVVASASTDEAYMWTVLEYIEESEQSS